MHSTNKFADTTSATGWLKSRLLLSEGEGREEEEVEVGSVFKALKAAAAVDCNGYPSAPFEDEDVVMLRNKSWDENMKKRFKEEG